MKKDCIIYNRNASSRVMFPLNRVSHISIHPLEKKLEVVIYHKDTGYFKHIFPEGMIACFNTGMHYLPDHISIV